MEEKLMELIQEIGNLEVELEPDSHVDDLIDEIGLDELSVAIEDEFDVIIDPSDMEDCSIADICAMIRDNR